MNRVGYNGDMGEVIRIDQYLERKAAETDPDAQRRRLAEIGREILILASERNRIRAILEQDNRPVDN